MITSFFGAAFFAGEFFNTPSPDGVTIPTPAGKSSKKKKRKVLLGDRMYEVDSLNDLEFLLKRVVRTEAEPVKAAAKARVRVTDTLKSAVAVEAPISLPIETQIDWSPLWNQLALQDRVYAEILERILMRQEEDDIEALLLLH